MDRVVVLLKKQTVQGQRTAPEWTQTDEEYVDATGYSGAMFYVESEDVSAGTDVYIDTSPESGNPILFSPVATTTVTTTAVQKLYVPATASTPIERYLRVRVKNVTTAPWDLKLKVTVGLWK